MLIGNSELLRRFLRNIYGQTLSIGNTEMFGKLVQFHGNIGERPKYQTHLNRNYRKHNF